MDLNEFKTGEEIKKEQEQRGWTKIADLVHYAKDDKSYKTLQLLKTDTGHVVLALREGVAGKENRQIIFQLSEQEIAYLSKKLEKLI